MTKLNPEQAIEHSVFLPPWQSEGTAQLVVALGDSHLDQLGGSEILGWDVCGK